MDLSIGVLLVLAALTFLLAAVLQCLCLRKHEELIARLERLQALRLHQGVDLGSSWSAEDLPSSHVIRRRLG